MANFMKIDEYLVRNGAVHTDDNGAKSINVDNILAVGVTHLGDQTKWYISITFVSGKTILVNVAGTPFATKALAIDAMDTFIASIPNSISDLADALGGA